MEQMEVDEEPVNNDKSLRKFLAIEYPGVVENVNSMLETLGGLNTISDIYANNKRLELRFRPSDKYCKPTCSDKSPTTGLILKVKYKRVKSNDGDDQTVVTSSNIIGVVDQIYKFNNLCDYQYLPVQQNEQGVLENIYDKLIPKEVPPLSWLEGNDVPYFLPPSNFCRLESTDGYKFRKSTKKDPLKVQHLIGRTGERRLCQAKNIQFSAPTVPTGPLKSVTKLLRTKFVSDDMLNRVKKLFDERPIWSRTALLYHTGLSLEKIKFTLPAVAYYFLTGPWRVMWIRFGYDPRTDPAARKYQTFDFRPRLRAEYKHLIQAKRSMNLTYKIGAGNSTSQRRNIYVGHKQKSKRKIANVVQENEFKFVPGMLPPARQMFYQYCDLEVPEIQAMLARLPEPGPDAVCSEKTGWLPSGIDERCREILKELIDLEVKAQIWKNQRDTTDEGDEDWEDFEISGDDEDNADGDS